MLKRMARKEMAEMTVTINLFALGVIATIAVEFVGLVVAGLVSSSNRVKNEKKAKADLREDLKSTRNN